METENKQPIIDELAGAREVEPVYDEMPKQMCHGENCIEYFKPTWHTQRRCQRCKKAKNGYKKEGHPF